ncbi:MAG: DUF2169 domain-containing protein, partial [Myxococcota bacterium]
MALRWRSSIHLKDRHYRGRPLAHVVHANDLVPRRSAVDVTLLGHARPTPDGALPPRVRLRLVQRGETAIDKTAAIRPSPDAPQRAVAVIYENAVGGVGSMGNPVGRDADDGDELPCVLDPEHP